MKQKISQRRLAELLQLTGVDLDKKAIQKIQSGTRFFTGIERKAFAQVFEITADVLLV